MSLGPRALLAAVAAALLLLACSARAQTGIEVHLQAGSMVVGLGDTVHVQMIATSSDVAPTDSRVGVPDGFVVRGHNSLPQQSHVFSLGAQGSSQTDRYTLLDDWALQAVKLGAFTIGPGSVNIGGKRFSSQALVLRVVPAAQAPARSRPQRLPPGFPPQSPFPPGFSPFDLWKNLLPPDTQFDEPEQQPPIATDPKLALEQSRGQGLFLHATVDKSNAGVGEQVIFSVYEYDQLDEPTSNIDDLREASTDDFVKRTIVREDQERPSLGYAAVGGHIWRVLLVRRWALFPLHAGDLEIGPMSVVVRGPRLQPSHRTSESLRVHVTEPPLAGRPPGYQIGDVGHFALSAQVDPREVEQGGAVAVHVEVSGTGNLPDAIATPARADVEWLSPEVHDKVGPIGDSGWGGSRTFDYVAKIKRAGSIDLGELALPYWSPEQKRYEVARASLGVVHARPKPGAPSDAAESSEILAGLPTPRGALAGMPAARRYADDSPLFWILGVAGAPLAFGVAVGGRAAGRRAAAWARARKESPLTELRGRVAAARVACGGSDPRGADAAVARALEAAVVAHAGVSVRGAVGNEVVERLERAGVMPDAASGVAELLRECEVARFSPDAADVAAARGRWTRAQSVIRRLEKGA
jgi:hypothetical protein